MSIETQLRDALTSHAGSIESVEAHPYERVAGAVAKNRTRRRTVGAAAVAVVAAIAIGVPTVSSRLADGRTTPAGNSANLPPATDKAWKSVTTWPTRGSLAGDTALVAAIGKQFDGRPIFVEDLGSTRVAVVVSRSDLVVGTGPAGAAAADMRRSSSGPISDVTDGVLSMVGTNDLIVLTTPDRTFYEMSRTPDIALDGTVSRSWQKAPLIAGFGRNDWTELSRLRLGAFVGQPRLGFMTGVETTEGVPCEGGTCNREPVAAQERDTNDLVARMLGLDRKAVTTETVFNGAVPRDFRTPGLTSDSGASHLHVMHSRLPGGQVLRSALLRDDNEVMRIELGRPIDAIRAESVPIISFGSGKSAEAPTTIHVVVPSGTAVRAVSDSPALWPSSAVVPLTNHVATFKVPVSPGAFDQNYRIEVLDGDRVLTSVRTTVPTQDVFQ
ncbi:hypothetical protein [Janibacter sp. HTCC2649]|uniref:hypothetical protein n=1 Tax=Janibacter sp. HTCC2649 TaxID=313589 RepID=UPI0002DE418C|nr:hypothetical protein [Janibacter sp. HTCC2649]